MASQTQREWAWPIAIEIFCGGTAGGAYILSVMPYLFLGGRMILNGVFASLILVCISVFVLIAESNSPWRMRKGFFNIRSPLTIGAISLSLLIILSIATLSIRYVGLVPWASYVVVWLGVTVSLAAIIYPGVLMGFMKAIPFWSGPGPSLLLLSASLLSGSALVALIGGLGHAGLNLSRMMLWLLIMNGLFISIHIFLGNQALKSTRTSVQPLLKGNLYLIFIMGVILVGLVSPFVLFIIGILSSSASMLQVGSVLILIGGILMRYSLIASGVKMSVLSEDSITASYWMDRS